MVNHRPTVVPPCVNGGIAIQLEWSNFHPHIFKTP